MGRNAAATGDRTDARRELTIAAGTMTNWHEHFAASLTRRKAVPEPLAQDRVAAAGWSMPSAEI
jgi:hypothetical protein